jgi:hypothetical protein
MGKFFELLTLGVIGVIAVAIFLAWPTQWLWNNCLVGAVDGVNEIGLWQALGINFLSSILFKGVNYKTNS